MARWNCRIAASGSRNGDHMPQVPLDYTYTYEVYRRRGYSVCPTTLQRGYLHLHRPVDCRTLFEEVLGTNMYSVRCPACPVHACWTPASSRWRTLRGRAAMLAASGCGGRSSCASYCCLHLQVLADQTSNLLATPPQFVPSIYRNEYLLDGHVDLQTLPVSDVYNGNPKPLEWSQVQAAFHTATILQHARLLGNTYTARVRPARCTGRSPLHVMPYYKWDLQEHLDDMVARAGRREHLSYGEWANAVYNALASVDVTGQRGVVVGSETPWWVRRHLFCAACMILLSASLQSTCGGE